LLKEGAVNDTDTTPDEPPDAAPIVGAEDAPFVPALCAPRIGIFFVRLDN
jgi:hypothetical protein